MTKLLEIIFVCSLLLLSSGCRLCHNAWRTTVAEPIRYSREAYDKWGQKRFRDLAACALDEATSVARAELDDYSCDPFSVDYRQGFIDGFVDYLEAGGSGNPSPLPPRRYWRAKYQNPAGFQRAQDWFRGFQHGTGAAQASNLRAFVTVPLSDSVVASTTPYTYGRISAVETTEESVEDVDDDFASHGDESLPELLTETTEQVPHLTNFPEAPLPQQAIGGSPYFSPPLTQPQLTDAKP